ncbi:hypothetical protein Pcinc_003375 [Petrolisthes cinctipes]|uniref:Uncharacterized protein n=1 Tax=Petrolisthes cinctipes TaxID=88211 RepID=A0AAE1GJ48_PETCI|nr:hypothetical protein Pcinc_003375 [Petrolisthes cinctipes]
MRQGVSGVDELYHEGTTHTQATNVNILTPRRRKFQASRWTFQATRMDGQIGQWDIKPDQMQQPSEAS